MHFKHSHSRKSWPFRHKCGASWQTSLSQLRLSTLEPWDTHFFHARNYRKRKLFILMLTFAALVDVVSGRQLLHTLARPLLRVAHRSRKAAFLRRVAFITEFLLSASRIIWNKLIFHFNLISSGNWKRRAARALNLLQSRFSTTITRNVLSNRRIRLL